MKSSNCAVLFSLVLLGCLSFGQQPSTSPPGPGSTSPSQVALRDGNYVLQVGDELLIKAFEHSDLDETVRIRPDGRISVQLIPDITAADLTPSELSSALDRAYKKFFTEPRISVIVRSFAAERVYVGGEVLQPGVLPISGDVTILGAVMQAGGFRPTARKDSILLLRNDGQGGKSVQLVNVKRLLSKGGSDMKLQPFDVVYVPQSRIAKVDQFVDQWIRQVLPGTLTGGFTYLFGSTVFLPTK